MRDALAPVHLPWAGLQVEGRLPEAVRRVAERTGVVRPRLLAVWPLVVPSAAGPRRARVAVRQEPLPASARSGIARIA